MSWDMSDRFFIRGFRRKKPMPWGDSMLCHCGTLSLCARCHPVTPKLRRCQFGVPKPEEESLDA